MAAALPECYHGVMSKRECEELLGRKNKDGAYLIRESESIHGALCLCVYKQRVVYTYRVLQAHNGNYTLLTAGGLEETYFKTLDDLIRNYKRKNQGLAMHLRRAVKKKTPMLIQPPRRQDARPVGLAGVSAGHSSQRKEAPSPEFDHDYESTSHMMMLLLQTTWKSFLSSFENQRTRRTKTLWDYYFSQKVFCFLFLSLCRADGLVSFDD